MLKQSTFDKLAIILSSVCLLHCLLTPVLITLLPILSLSAVAEELLFHQLMLWLILPTSVVALFIGCRKHRHWHIAVTGFIGIVTLVSVAFFGHQWFGITGEKIATTVGGLVLALSHYLNFRACQNVPCADKNCAVEHHH